MTNFEYWKDRILEIIADGDIAVVDEKPERCLYAKCKDCLFSPSGKCAEKLFNWLYSEHKEKPKLTKRERIFCETILYPDDKKITRAFEDLFIGTKGKLEIAINPYMFSFIEKGNPWSVSDLLQLEVEE